MKDPTRLECGEVLSGFDEKPSAIAIEIQTSNQETVMSYALDYPIADRAPGHERATFIRRTYGHLAGAVLAFIALEVVFLSLPGLDEAIIRPMLGGAWIIVMLAFMGASYLARY